MRSLVAFLRFSILNVLIRAQGHTATPLLLHSPTISHSQIVLVYANELRTVPLQGGAAHLLTSGPGIKSSPALSPDGKWLAPGLDYEGNVDVYTMLADNGVATFVLRLAAQNGLSLIWSKCLSLIHDEKMSLFERAAQMHSVSRDE